MPAHLCIIPFLYDAKTQYHHSPVLPFPSTLESDRIPASLNL